MSLYKKLDCTCGHGYDCHIDSLYCGKGICNCKMYDPVGHNPELENVLCPKCKLTHLEKLNAQYICVLCYHVMSESQIWELVG